MAPISLNYIIAVILYCDEDLLSFRFSSTYRPLDKAESIEHMIERHRNYYWFGRYLRELVEGFGKEIEVEDGAYYHGISGNVRFTSTIAKFHHPMSTTKQVAVAQRFAGNNGFIISVTIHQFGVPYFDCNWISKYGNEEESLFIGGIFPLQIANIINCLTGEQYAKYLRAINMLGHIFDANYNIYEMKEEDDKLIQSMIDDKDVPSYIRNLFISYRHRIKLNLGEIVKYSPYLSSILLTNAKNRKTSFINLNFLQTLFPKSNSIQFSNILLSSEYIYNISTSLAQYQWSSLNSLRYMM